MKNNFGRLMCAFGLVILVLGVLPAIPAQAATLTVDTLVDENDGSCSDGDCSLRDAIYLAPGGAIINFSINGTILLDSELVIDKDLIIDGDKFAIVINGKDSVRVFMVAETVTVNLNHLTISGGYADQGGGIYVGGTLNLNDSLVTDNIAQWGGGIYSPGTAKINASIVSANTATIDGAGVYNSYGIMVIENGSVIGGDGAGNIATGGASAGGIFSYGGTLIIDSSTVSGNISANSAGGLMVHEGTATITNSTFSGNHAVYFGGGAFSNNVLDIYNSTFSANITTGDGGGVYNSGTLTVTNSTFSGNAAGTLGGGIRNDGGAATLTNTIIANSPTGNNCSGVFNGKNGNLVWGDSTCPGIQANPLLSILGEYGGTTRTHALLPGSAAIDAGDDDVCAAYPVNNLDQRLVARPQGDHCDMGAFESHGFALSISSGNDQSVAVYKDFSVLEVYVSPLDPSEPVQDGWVQFTAPAAGASANLGSTFGVISGLYAGVSATANGIVGSYFVMASATGASSEVKFSLQNTCADELTVINDHDSGAGSLRQAIASICTGGTITFAADYHIPLLTPLTIADNMTMDGEDHTVTVSGDSDSDGVGEVRAFTVNSGVTFNLSRMTIAKGNGALGGGLENLGTVIVTNCVFSENNATEGGGIYNSGTISISGSTFPGNSASDGGGIYNVGTASIVNTSFSGNSAVNGGGLYNYMGILEVTSSTFLGNIVTSRGGAINSRGGSLYITNNTFSTNSAADGGGMFNEGGSVIVTNSTFFNNNATYGGGVRAISGTITLRNTILSNNNPGGNCSNPVVDGGGNLVWGDATCPGVNADPKLSALGLYGGPRRTFALLPGSAAIDAGDDAICAAGPVFNLDQRGVARPQGSHCDIGAFESRGFILTLSAGNSQATPVNTAFTNPLQVSISPVFAGVPVEPVEGGTVTFTPPASGASAVVTSSPAVISAGLASVTVTANDMVGLYNVTAVTSGAASGVDFALQNSCAGSSLTVINSDNDGSGSLRRAVANICPGGMVTFAGDTTIFLASQLVIDKNMTIDGADHHVTASGDTDNNGSPNVRVFQVNPGVTMNMDHLTITHGYAMEGGGGIYNYGTLTIKNSTLTGNETPGAMGGAISNDYGSISIGNSTFTGNYGLFVGSVYNNSGTVTLTNSTFSGNDAFLSRGSILNYFGTLVLQNTIMAESGGNCYGTITDGGGNLVWGDTTCPGINADPKLSPLASNGGPTQTFALLAGSAALDAGDDTLCAADPVNNLDQRGTARPQGFHCDIGAYERVNQVPAITEIGPVSVTLDEDGSPLPFSLTLNGTDGNDDPLIWSISAPASNGAASASGTGASKAIGYTPVANYNGSDSFVVQVSDGYGGTDTITVNVTIDPVNDAPTDILLSKSNVDEHLPLYTAIGTLSSTDPDTGDTFTYTLTSAAGCSGADNASFVLSGSSLQTHALLNHESKSSYIVCIQTSDGLGGAFTRQFTITVNDVNEAPTNVLLSTSRISENRPLHTAIGTLSSTDPDAGQTFTYSLTSATGCLGTNNTSFVISGSSLQTHARFNYEVKSSYIICVQTNDGHGGTFRKQFTITITDLPETFTSTGSQDGWVLESSETSGIGGTLDAAGLTFYLGDNASDRQYRALLSFNTAALPDNAVITRLTLKIRYQGKVGVNPFTTHGNILVDIRNGYFSTSPYLQVGDFQAPASRLSAGTITNSSSGGWYSVSFASGIFTHLNKTGLTQFRLRFSKDDNDDMGTDLLKFYSGNYSNAAYRPVLLVEYTVP